MKHRWLFAPTIAATLGLAASASAVSSAELYQNQASVYGRFEARVRFAPGNGVVSSFFLWKAGSEVAGAYWNELDFEKIGADCHLQTNALYGAPVGDHSMVAAVTGDLCAEYHTYGFEWTPTYIAWLVDGVEARRETGATATAFAQNATAGMQMHFNIWPGDATFGGVFDSAILPVRQFISWIQYSSYANGTFALEWRDDFDAGTLPTGWATGNWPSPKNYSVHSNANVTLTSGIAVLSLTADNATGFSGIPPVDNSAGGVDSGSTGAGGTSTGGAEGNDAAGNAPSGDPGCNCHLVAQSRSQAGLGAVGLGIALAFVRRRRARRVADAGMSMGRARRPA